MRKWLRRLRNAIRPERLNRDLERELTLLERVTRLLPDAATVLVHRESLELVTSVPSTMIFIKPPGRPLTLVP